MFSYNTTALHSLPMSSPPHLVRLGTFDPRTFLSLQFAPNKLFHFHSSPSPSPSTTNAPASPSSSSSSPPTHPLLPFCCSLYPSAPAIPLSLNSTLIWNTSLHDSRYLVLLWISKGGVFLQSGSDEEQPIYEEELLVFSPHTSPLPSIIAACDSELRVFYAAFSVPLLFQLGAPVNKTKYERCWHRYE